MSTKGHQIYPGLWIRENVFGIYLARKDATIFLPFYFFWLSQLNIRRFFPNKYWCKCWFQGHTTFIRVYFWGTWPFIEMEAAWLWCESLDSCGELLPGEFPGTRSWLVDVGAAAFSGFGEWDRGLCRLLSSPDLDECLFLPNSSPIGGSMRKSSNFLKLQRYSWSFGSMDRVLDWEYFR